MTPAKDKFKPGEAYVALSRVRTLEKITCNQLHSKSNPCVRTCRKKDEKAKEKTSCCKCHQIYFMMFQEV